MKTKSEKNKALLMVLGIVLALGVAAGLYFGIRALVKGGTPDQTDAPTGTAPSVTRPAETTGNPSNTEATDQDDLDIAAAKTKKVYTEANLSTDDPRLDNVIASCEGYSITSRDAQIYFCMQFYGFMNNYGSFASMYGLDASQPLSEQMSSSGGDLNWEQYFLMAGLDDFHSFAALATKAAAEGYTMLEGEAKQLSDVRDGLKERYAAYGYDSADAYVQANFGSSVRYEDYVRYLELYFYAMSYQNSIYQGIQATEEEINEFFETHPDLFQNVEKDKTNINVRHILITYETEEGASEEAVSAAKNEAEKKALDLLAEYKKDPTEEHFAELATQNTADPGSKETGGLYEEVYPGQMVQPFNDWCFDPARKPGDTGIVETSYGFHVMYFVSTSENYYWKTESEKYVRSDRMMDYMDELLKQHPMTTDYENLFLCELPKQSEQ